MKTVYWSLADGMVCLIAEVPDDGAFIATGYMADIDDKVETVDWTNKKYKTAKNGWTPFPANGFLKPQNCNWRVYRVENKFYE